MGQITITPLEDAGVEVLPPDIVWNGFVGDFAVAMVPADGGVGGLVARNPIRSAVLMLLFTDAQADEGDLTFAQRGDRRGWVGDGFDIDDANGEAQLGSRLWLFRRAVLNAATLTLIEAEAQRALQPLIDQGLVVRIDVGGTVDPAANTLNLAVALYGRDGTKVYAARFDPLWKRADGL